jgi:hypothetical protein
MDLIVAIVTLAVIVTALVGFGCWATDLLRSRRLL